MEEGRGRARGFVPSRPPEQQQSAQPGARRSPDTGHAFGGGNGSGSGNAERPSGGRASHRGGLMQDFPGETTRPRRVPRGRRAILDDEATVTYRDDPSKKHGAASDQRVELYANYVRFVKKRFVIYQYRVEFSPEFDDKRGRNDIVRKNVRNKSIRYDGREILYSPDSLGEGTLRFTEKHPSGNGDLEISLIPTNRFGSTDPQALNYLNIAFGNDMQAIGMKRIQRHYFLVGPQHSRRVQGMNSRLDVLPGFATAYSERDGGVLLNIDLVSKVLRAETANDTMQNAYNQCRGSVADAQAEASRAVIGQVVYAKYSNQTYRIEDVDFKQNPTSMFEKDGKTVTYVQYFKQRWNCTITDMLQPLLVAKPRKIPGQRARPGGNERVNLVPELVYLTGLTEEMRRDFTLTRSMAQTTNATPQARYDSIVKVFHEMVKSKEVQDNWQRMGLEFEQDLLTVQGSVLKNEDVVFAGEKTVPYDGPENPDWSRGMRDAKLLTSVKIERWYLLYPSRYENDVKEFVRMLQQAARVLGMEMRDPRIESLNNDSPSSYANALQRLLHRHLEDKVQLVVCVMGGNRKDSYDAIKKHCCLINPVPSQVLLARTIGDQKKMRSVATKVAIQINAKLGGEPWTVKFLGLNAMIVGVDVYHDTTRREQSFVGMVSSIDNRFTQYYSQTHPQIAGQEMASQMGTMIQKALRAYITRTGNPPSRIFYYRDGVADGQLAMIVNDELAQMDTALASMGVQVPKLTAVIVKKRINTRFMLKSSGEKRNPVPGTIVDTEITKPNWCDFYLVSQSARQGTVAPTHYNVVRSGDFGIGHIQKLTYKLAHMYFNWSGTIRVPAPCQYAHKVAFITGESLHEAAHNALADKLWFL